MKENALPFYVLRGGEFPVRFVQFSRDGSELLSTNEFGEVLVWDLDSLRTRDVLKIGPESCMWASYGTRGSQIHAYSRGKGLRTVDRATSKVVCELPSSHAGYCKPTAAANAVYYPDGDSNVVCYDVVAGKTRRVVDATSLDPGGGSKLGMVLCLKVVTGAEDRSGDTLFCGYEGGHVVALTTDSGSCSVLPPPSGGDGQQLPCFALDFDAVASRGLTGSADRKLRVFRMTRDGGLAWDGDDSGGNAENATVLPGAGVGVVGIRSRVPGISVAGCWDGRLRILGWDDPGTPPRLVTDSVFHKKSIESVAFSDGEICTWGHGGKLVFAVGSMDSRISLWDVGGEN